MGGALLLILDELFVGLDLIGVEKFREYINSISKEKGVAILISSHQLSELKISVKDICLFQNKS